MRYVSGMRGSFVVRAVKAVRIRLRKTKWKGGKRVEGKSGYCGGIVYVPYFSLFPCALFPCVSFVSRWRASRAVGWHFIRARVWYR